MKLYADKKRRDVTYSEGDWVFFKIRPYRQKSLAKCFNEKLSLRYFGPYQATQQVRKVAYKLDLPKNCPLHPMFHVS